MVRLAAAAALLALAGCAGTGDRVLRMDPDPGGSGAGIFFPGPPDVPRYLYAGQLIGEGNYDVPGQRTRAGVRGALAWIVGLDEGSEAPEQLQRPQSGLIDAKGRVLVTDGSRQAVVVFEPVGGMQAWPHARGLQPFKMPVGIAATPDNRIFVADAELGFVVEMDAAGKGVRVIGQGQLERPTGVAYDPQGGRLYVADTNAHDIKVFALDGTLLKTIGERGEGPGQFNFPTHLAYARGDLYVADTMNSRVQVLSTADDRHRLTVGARGLYVGNMVRPKGVSVDSEGNIYVVESYFDHLLVFDRDGRFLMAIGGLGKDVGQFYLPAGVWTDDRNRVFVADMFNGRVVVLQFLGGDNGR